MLQNGATRSLTIVCAILVAQIGLFHLVLARENQPAARPLAELPRVIGPWNTVAETSTDQQTMEILKADDTLNRVYADKSRSEITSLFVAFFKSQRAGVAPHSPKVCMLGAGWFPVSSGALDIPVLGSPVRVNRDVMENQGQRSLVLYWFQTHRRVIASEYAAKLYLILDSIRDHRSDTSLVRVIVQFPVGGEPAAEQGAVAFVKSFVPVLRAHVP